MIWKNFPLLLLLLLKEFLESLRMHIFEERKSDLSNSTLLFFFYGFVGPSKGDTI